MFLSLRAGIMDTMDTTTGSTEPNDHDALMEKLATVDPADAPEVAKDLVERLSEDLDAAPAVTGDES